MLTYENDHLITSVIDTGIGIQAEDLRKLFRFFGKIQDPNDLNKGGIGMGLTISKMIVQQLIGDISVESSPNNGSKFQFSIKV